MALPASPALIAVQLPPVVYVGPSLAPEAVREHLPGAQLMPPISRGNLYRDRMLGFNVFLILDGVFFQQLAIPPREIIDVLADGACVLGASSMGAIRAAECWPAGMRGVGTIYRLFRRGALESDDEVAVAFAAEAPYRIATIPLVNIRFAVSRVLRQGGIDNGQARRLIETARETFYTERNWRALLRRAGLEDADDRLRSALAACDLKQMDSIRALRVTRTLLERQPGLLAPAQVASALQLPGKVSRERNHDAFGGMDAGIAKPYIWRWLLASGRYRQIAWLAEKIDPAHVPQDFPDAVWARLAAEGELDAIVYRYRAVSKAAATARSIHLEVDMESTAKAEADIAKAHGFADWNTLRNDTNGREGLWAWVQAHRTELGLATRFKATLQRHSSAEG